MRDTIANPLSGAKYYPMKPLDQGGFGKVWSGVSSSGFPVAIKVWTPTSDPVRDLEGWRNEQSLCIRCLNHRHIVRAYDTFRTRRGHLVIVMEHAGGSLQDYIKAGRALDPMDVCVIGLHVLRALHHIHDLGVIHRDVTLKNILWFKNGIFKLADFGIAKDGVSAGDIARSLVGAPSFVPPELHAHGYSTHQSDIYQLGLVLLALLTGQDPIPHGTGYDIRDAILRGIPYQMSKALVPRHRGLATIISRMVNRNPGGRYRSADRTATDLHNELAKRQLVKNVVQKWLRQRRRAAAPGWLGKR